MIEIRLFRFNALNDYLPYYKTYELEYNAQATLQDILEELDTIESFGFLKDAPFFLQANHIFTSSTTLISEIVKENEELVLEPLSIKRAVNDLIIDTKDYKEKLALLDKYMSSDEKEKIIKEKTYMLEYYASNTLHFYEDYIGEHVVLLALDIVKQDASLEAEIFALLNSEEGIVNKSSLKYRIVNYPETTKVASLTPTIEQSFENFNIAFYCGLQEDNFHDVILQSKAEYVNLLSKHFDIPLKAKRLSYLMAGTILLEAVDNNADFLIVPEQKDLKLFDTKQKAIEKVMGREIGFPVLTQDEFLQLLAGEKDKKVIGLHKHKVNVTFLDA